MILSCCVHMQNIALDCLVTGIAGSTERDTTRWVTTCLKVLEEVDAANPDGIAVLLRFNSSEKDVSTLCRRYSAALHQQCCAKCCPHSDVAHNWEGGVSGVLLCVSCFSCTSTSLDPPLLPSSCFPQNICQPPSHLAHCMTA